MTWVGIRRAVSETGTPLALEDSPVLREHLDLFAKTTPPDPQNAALNRWMNEWLLSARARGWVLFPDPKGTHPPNAAPYPVDGNRVGEGR